MITLRGKGICDGIAFGRMRFVDSPPPAAVERQAVDPASEVERYRAANCQAIASLDDLYAKAVADVGEAGAEILSVHQMMLDDEDFREAVESAITDQRISAEAAVAVAESHFADVFEHMDDDYMRGRALDIHDIADQLRQCLAGGHEAVNLDSPAIVAGRDLTPSQTMRLDRANLLGLVTAEGSPTSHTAILARALGIPAVIGVGQDLTAGCDGVDAIVDGESGVVYLEPDDETRRRSQSRQAGLAAARDQLDALRGLDNVSKDGVRVDVFANIGGPGDLEAVTSNDAGGVGLFRTEFLYLGRDDYPSEEEQFEAYKAVAQGMGGKLVIVRTLDIGADKQAGYFGLPPEENPALGMRAIRLCLTRQDIFVTQLRAIYRASDFGELAIMLPMIASVDEVRQAKEIAARVLADLDRAGVAHADHVPIGIMVETPAAAVISDLLAEEAEFFSIGTNDLTQYTLAIDRQNQALDQFRDPHHLAVLRLIARTVDNGHRHGIKVGICGELGADTSLTATFLAMGVDELSVSASSVMKVRQAVRQTDVGAVRDSLDERQATK